MSDSSLVIRRLLASDYQDFLKLCEPLDSLHTELLPHIFQKPEEQPRTREQFIEWTSNPQIGLFGVEANSQLVAFSYAPFADFKNPFYRARKVVLLDMISVDPKWQRQGIGKKLTLHVTAWAKEQGAEDVWVTVWAANRSAVEFYRKLGFEDSMFRLSLSLLGSQ